ncbi:hypothetical protein [Mesorhizobium sp. M0767]|uniref:MoaF-related domain-containing protein n=1 Tax=unclassified Mesorhizobium TaxID=325217 RepID=UPI00333CB08C
MTFPGNGNRYLVDFTAFQVQLDFASDTSLTYAVLAADGTPSEPETVAIKAEKIADRIYLVTWQEADKTTVVHVEDYTRQTIVTNITNPDLSFEQYHGNFVQAKPVKTVGFAHDILPLFRPIDVNCMRARRVFLADIAWMAQPANASKVLAKLSAGEMPPGAAWPPDRVNLFSDWIDGGYQP